MAQLKLQLPPPPPMQNLPIALQTWLTLVYQRLNDGPFLIEGIAVADLPDPADWSDGTNYSAIIFVNNESTGAAPAFSDGTNWRLFDRTIVS